MPEQAKRAFDIARASARRKRLKDLALALGLGLIACGLIVGLILLLNRR